MEKVKEYTVVAGSSIKELNQKVNVHLKSDWQPIGGITVVEIAVNKDGEVLPVRALTQAMVKY